MNTNTTTNTNRTKTTTDKMMSRVQKISDAIERTRDRLEIKAHLGKMELETALNEARPHIAQMRRDIEELTEEARGRMRVKMKQLDDRMGELKNRYVS